MNRMTASLGVVLLAAEAIIAQTPPARPSASSGCSEPVERRAVSPHQAVVDKYCAGCHNDRRKSGGFSWSTIDLSNPAGNAEASERVIRKLTAGLMPPAGAPRPEQASTDALIASLETSIDRAAALHPFAGAPEDGIRTN